MDTIRTTAQKWLGDFFDPAVRKEGRAAIDRHPLAHRIHVVEGDPGSPEIIAAVHALGESRSPVVVVLDLIHTHDHVKRELEQLGPLVTPGAGAGYLLRVTIE